MSDQSTLRTKLDIIQQKARERTVKTQTVEYDLDTLAKRIDRKSIKLDPDYQRRHRWTLDTSSRLIESLILNIPIPVVFISQDIDVDAEISDDTSRYTVIDGQQRLTAIHDYLRNKYPLQGLETLSELNGTYYKQLPTFLIRRLEERTIRCMRIDSTVDDQVKFDIFERLNTGSVRLESQELRNAIARGKFNELTKRLAETREFRSLIQVDPENPDENAKVKKMEDVELVLRFFALRNGRYRAMKKGFKEFLTTTQTEFNAADESTLSKYESDFATYMHFLYTHAGPKPFAKWRIEPSTKKQMSSFNAAVYDAVAVGLAESFSSDHVRENPGQIAVKLEGYTQLFGDREFFASVSGSVNDAAKVAFRIEAVKAYLER